MIIKFCSDCDACPVVDIQYDKVLIGEKDNICELTKSQWNDLIKTIKKI